MTLPYKILIDQLIFARLWSNKMKPIFLTILRSATCSATGLDG